MLRLNVCIKFGQNQEIRWSIRLSRIFCCTVGLIGTDVGEHPLINNCIYAVIIAGAEVFPGNTCKKAGIRPKCEAAA